MQTKSKAKQNNENREAILAAVFTPLNREEARGDLAQEIANDDAAAPKLTFPGRQRLAIGEAADWLRRGAPGRALEVLENLLAEYERNDNGNQI